jgi:demethylmenaquinone methyltransferase/2-methoxy-6-polyprenyl-1,4-benzoquinol methylase
MTTVDGFPLVERAKKRATELGFEQSADPDVGRLLAVLAAGVRRDGRILEIGTGAGYGLAWIIAGLAGRSDVEVTSVEIDGARQAAVARDGWPPFVRLVQGDVLTKFDTLGRFDLIFADAQGGKWEGLDRTIGALEPGGLLVVDDMRSPTVRIVPDQDAKAEAVRTALLTDSRLLSVELDWATGIILARRRWQ